MKRIEFTKMVASGNDFVLIDQRFSGSLAELARILCDRKSGVGADGLLVLGKSKKADLRMRIFNADGSEAEMCGNGARCTAYYSGKNRVSIETKAGVIHSEITHGKVRIRFASAKNIKLDFNLKVCGRLIKASFINTGVPHTVIFVDSLDKINVFDLGRIIRRHKMFLSTGTNVDFVEVLGKNRISVRTYERGVEDETLACGTGSTAAALIFALKTKDISVVDVLTQSKEALRVSFKRVNKGFENIWLEGKVKKVYKGVYYV